MNKIETPTLDIMIEIQEQSQLCGEFLDWLLRKYTMFDRKQKRESPFANVMGNGDYINKEKLLAEFFDIDLVEADCDVVVTHGNGPQIGMINNAMAALTREVEGQPNTPLSVCVAMSQAYIGYDLQNALHEELLNRGIKDLPTMTC